MVTPKQGGAGRLKKKEGEGAGGRRWSGEAEKTRRGGVVVVKRDWKVQGGGWWSGEIGKYRGGGVVVEKKE